MTDAERGFADARNRLNSWLENGDYQNPTSFLDALHHLYALEESHKARLGNAVYFTTRDANAEGRVVGGMIYARGIITHAGAEAVALIGGRPFTIGRSVIGGQDQIGGQGVTVIWRLLAELPLPGKPEKHDREVMYGNHVAGRDVVDTFSDADGFFSSLPI